MLIFLNRPDKYKPLPARRCFIFKSLGVGRLFEISTIQDRCLQILTKLVLDPVIESCTDLHSFGFSKNRPVKSALAVVRYMLKNKYYNKFLLNVGVKNFSNNLLFNWLLNNLPLAYIFKDFLIQ